MYVLEYDSIVYSSIVVMIVHRVPSTGILYEGVWTGYWAPGMINPRGIERTSSSTHLCWLPRKNG